MVKLIVVNNDVVLNIILQIPMSIVENSFVFDTHVQQPKDMSQNALETVPIPEAQPHGNIPNTPLASSFIAFSLGIVFTLGSLLFALGGYPGSVWLTDRLGAYLAFWALFHWLEFAVTAGWNREKLSVDCESTPQSLEHAF